MCPQPRYMPRPESNLRPFSPQADAYPLNQTGFGQFTFFLTRGLVHEICTWCVGVRGRPLSPACNLSNPGPLGGCPSASLGTIPQDRWLLTAQLPACLIASNHSPLLIASNHLSPRHHDFVQKNFQKDVSKTSNLSGLISILNFY
uniref:Uncharacterized protein n=1 Tax=Pipistrellus kuhlii TaxID=59472 RepID=A0A7J7ZJR6_PIPKU|nr:hypothetical protein mPipKuh1_009549 [Pipistrellus kuhlii]